MLYKFSADLYAFIISLTKLYSIAQLIGFVTMFTVVAVVSARQGHNWKRFFHRPFLTDLAYGAWFPVYTVLIGIPISLTLAGFVSNYVPFLHLGLLRGVPWWLNIPIWLIVSDFVLYWLHRSLHQVRWLWVFHKIHHSQTELSPLTTWRSHWLEFVYLSSGGFVTGLLLGGISPLHPVVIGLFAASQFAQHSDLDWSYGPLGRIIVSPRFHARHHSTANEDLNVNFGFLSPIWDDLFGTARRTPGCHAT